MIKENLKRLRPFEGLCITAKDLSSEQQYHRNSMARHSLNLHGFGIVQGLGVDIQYKNKSYYAVIDAGYGITQTGQGVQLSESSACRLELPSRNGDYFLWLFHVESQDQTDLRPIFDTNRTESARIVESCVPRLHHKQEGEYEDAVLLCQIKVFMSRMSQAQTPVPRAGRQQRAAESYLKPKVIEFISLNRKIISLLHRTQSVRETDLPTLSFNSALISAEFLLIEEGTSDRVLYRTAGSLVSYAHDYYEAQPNILESINHFKTHIRTNNARMPNSTQSNEVWLSWFLSFETTLRPLQQISEELVSTIGPQR